MLDRAVWCVGKVVQSDPPYFGGMTFFGSLAAKVLDAPLYAQCPVGTCDTVHIVGLYDPPNYELTLESTKLAKRRVFHWCGTDVEMLRDSSILPEATHVCDSANLRAELLEKGIDAAVVPWPTAVHAPVTPLPEQPTIAMYVGSDPVKYGAGIAQAAVDALLVEFPDLRVAVYRHGQYPPEAMPDLIAQSSVYLRLTAHDGGAMSAREFMEAGRRAVVTADMPHASVVTRSDFYGVVAALRTALRATEPDLEAAAYYREFNCEERFLSLMEEAGAL